MLEKLLNTLDASVINCYLNKLKQQWKITNKIKNKLQIHLFFTLIILTVEKNFSHKL